MPVAATISQMENLATVMSIDPHALKLYIDGNAYNNPGGSGGIACRAEYPESWNRPDEEIFTVGFHESTNNRMELQACLRALEYVRDEVRSTDTNRVQIITDSLYVFNNQRMPVTWRRNGWKTNAGRPVENADLWKRMLTLRPLCKVRTDIIWQKGKKSPILKSVDKAAKAAGKSPTKHDRGFRAGKIGRSKLTDGSSTLFAAKGQQQVIRVYKSSLIQKTGHKIHFDVFDEVSGQFREKCRAYVDASLIDELHRGHTYRVVFNSEPLNPMVISILEEVKESLLKP
jgi:ribonuclease HI